MKNLIVAAMLALLPATARAASFTCETVAGPLNLCIPKINTDWPSWSSATVNTFRLLGAGAPVNSTSAVTTAATFQTRRISGVSTGTPNIWISSPTIVSITTEPFPSGFLFVSSGSVLVQSTGSIAGQPIIEIRDQAGGTIFKAQQDRKIGISTNAPATTLDVAGNAQFGSGAVKSTITATGDISLGSNADLTLTGPTAYLTSGSSVNASAFFGNGAGLTGLASSGKLLQFVSSMTTGMHTNLTAIPYDNTIPQISEGTQVLVATMTPTNATSNIRIQGLLNMNESVNSNNDDVACIWRDTTANAIACFPARHTEATGNASWQMVLDYTVPSTDTTLRNYSIRFGNAGTGDRTLNAGASGAAKFGGKIVSSLFLSEIAP